ncbi:MAG: sporulation peptidase YabG [Armatimonadota bacterium]
MARIAKGDIVARRSYKMDIYFKVCDLYVAGDGRSTPS